MDMAVTTPSPPKITDAFLYEIYYNIVFVKKEDSWTDSFYEPVECNFDPELMHANLNLHMQK